VVDLLAGMARRINLGYFVGDFALGKWPTFGNSMRWLKPCPYENRIDGLGEALGSRKHYQSIAQRLTSLCFGLGIRAI
jgi:hypothetical protein